MSVFDVMICKIGEKVSRMRPVPVIKGWQDGCVSGEYTSGPDSTYLLEEDPAWRKVDKLVVKALDAMKKKGVKSPLSELQEAAFRCAMSSDDRGLQLFAWRLTNTRHFVEEWGRIRKVALGKEASRSTDRLLYGGNEPRGHAAVLGRELRARGILKAKQK